MEPACCLFERMLSVNVVRQEWRTVEEPLLHAVAITVARGNSRQQCQKRDRPAVMEHVHRIEPTGAQCGQHADKSDATIVRATPRLRIAIEPKHVADRALGAEYLIGGGTRLGDQRNRFTHMRGDRADVWQMPDHVANSGQWLDDRDGHVGVLRPAL